MSPAADRDSPSERKRSTRDRPAKPPLSEAAVVDAALTILKAEGLEAVTMRRVAAALDTSAGSLYVYVANREGLIRAIQDRITATIQLEPPDAAHWREQLHTLLGRMRQALVAHPGIARAAMADPPTTGAALRLTENLLAIQLAGGIDPQDAAWAADVFAQLATYAAIENNARQSDPRQLADDLYKNFSDLPREQFPTIVALAVQLVAGDSDERFRFAVDVVLDGMLTRTSQ